MEIVLIVTTEFVMIVLTWLCEISILKEEITRHSENHRRNPSKPKHEKNLTEEEVENRRKPVH